MKFKNLDERILTMETSTDVPTTIQDIVESGIQEEAFYVCDVDDIIQKYITWTTLMPRITPFYAVKCNDNSIVLRVMAALGMNFDCASKPEMQTVLGLGVKPNRIVYAHATKPPNHIRYAKSVGVKYTTFDSEAELVKCKNMYPDAKMIIRIRCDSPTAIHRLGSKYGCHAYNEAPKLLEFARSHNITVVGVAFHVGTGCEDPPVFYKAIAASRHVFNCAETLGFKFDLLDIGGGFPGDQGCYINEFTEVINSALEEFFPDSSVKVIAEPGTYFVRSAFTLTCNIFGLKSLHSTDPVTEQTHRKYMYYIDDGLYGSFSRVIHVENVLPLPVKRHSNSTLYPSVIWGPTCDSIDRVAEEVLLPKLELGDWLMFENMGDYSMSISSKFNGFHTPTVYAIADNKTWSFLKQKSPTLFAAKSNNGQKPQEVCLQE